MPAAHERSRQAHGIGRGLLDRRLDRALRHATIRRLPEGVSPLTLEGSGPGSAPAAFGPFRVLHQLGAGTLGPVFRAHDPAEGRLVAIKQFRLDLTPERAVELAASLDDLVGCTLNHPTLTTPLAAGLEGTTPWLAQTYVPAEPLDAALRQFGPAPIAHVVTVVTHLAGALDFAAAAGVLHGSLHPRDILVAPGETSLIDIGVAPALERCGIRTPVRRPYSAPERVEGGPASRAADVFALGAIAFELLTGQPVAGAGDASLAQLPEIPGADADALRAAFASALAVDPDARPGAALTFAASLKSALGTASFRTTPAVAPRKSQRTTPMLPLDAPGVPADSPALPHASDAGIPAQDERPPVRVPDGPASVAPPHPAAAAPPASAAATAADVPALETFEHEEPARAAASLASEPPRFAHVEHEEPPAPPTHDTFRPARAPVAPAPRPPHQSVTRSLPAAVVFVVLAAALTGFGVGWLWSAWSGAPADPGVRQEPAAGRADRVEIPDPDPIVAADGAAEESGAGGAEASSGVDPEGRSSEAAGDGASPAPAAEPARTEPPAPVLGRLLVRSTPAGAIVRIDGRSRGRTPLTVRDLPLGPHTVIVSRPGYEPERRTLDLSRDQAARSLEVSLREAGPVRQPEPTVFTGSMRVESRPSGARVVVDGKEEGRTPVTLSTVRAGSHVVRIEMDGYRTWTASVRVVAGERRRVTASLEQMQ